MALGAIVNVNNANLPEDFDATMNVRYVYRPHFEPLDLERKFGNLTLTYAMQIHGCVLEIDPETGVYEVVDYAVIDDCGNRINPQIVEGQVMGATAHALGAATWETFAYDEDGNLLTPELLRLPRARTRSTCRRSRRARSSRRRRSRRSAPRAWARAAAPGSTPSAPRCRTRSRAPAAGSSMTATTPTTASSRSCSDPAATRADVKVEKR